MAKFLTSLVLAAVMIGAAPNRAAADPFIVTFGQLTFDFEGDWFGFWGDGFSVIQGSPENVGLFFDRISQPTCTICAPGEIVNPSFRTPGEILLGTGSRASFGSTTYSDVTLRGTLGFDATPVPFPQVTGDFHPVSTPFLFSGFLRGFAGADEIFAAPFTGRGLAHLPFVRLDDGRYAWEEGRLDFVFSDQETAPIPEPSTLLMLVIGGAAAARFRSSGA